MDYRTRPTFVSVLSITAITCVASPLAAQDAAAPPPAVQTAQVQQLPPIVVQGATLDKPKTAPKKPAQPAAAMVEDEPAPAKKKAAASKSKAKPAAAPAAPPSAAAAEAAAGADVPGDAVPEAGEGVPSDRIGSAVTVVTGEQLKSQQVRHAGDALRSLPGVTVSRTGSVGGLTQVRIRGGEGNHTVVMIDGIEANDSTNGEFDFSDLATDDIERIEVIRGAQSVIAGSGAIGGVINIVTRSGRGPLTFQATGEAGSFGTVAGHARVSGGNANFWGSLSAGKRKTDGFDISPAGVERDGSELSTLNVRAGARLLPGLTLDLTLRHTAKTGNRDDDDFAPPIGNLVTQIDSTSTFDASTWLGGAALRWDSADGAFTQNARVTRNSTRRIDDSPGFSFGSDGETIRYGYDATYRFAFSPAARHAITGLVENEDEWFTPLGTFGDGTERQRGRVAYAAEYRGEYFDRLFVTAGIRHDDQDSFEDFTTWRTTASLKLPELFLRPHASVGTAFKAPTMFEQFGSIPLFFTPNPNLTPEESFTWDAGVEVALPGTSVVVDVTYFNSRLENFIDGFAPGPFGTLTSVNAAGTAHREGVEVAARWQAAPGLSFGGAYTYLETERPDGEREFRRPRHTGRADMNYLFAGGRGALNVAAVYNGTFDDRVRRAVGIDPLFGFTILQAERLLMDDYWLVSVAASYKVLPGVELFGRVENALDTRYQEIFGFETAGVAAFAGVRFTYEEPSTAHWAAYR